MADTSAAYVVAIVAIVAGLTGSLLLTVVDPVMQAVFDSMLWSASTSTGSDMLGHGENAWTYWPIMILLGIMLMVWVKTRQPT